MTPDGISPVAAGRPTTIVVPLYGDPDSAERCIRSVLAHVDLARHRLLLVNDCGPDVDRIEALALGLVDGVDGARYVRNPQNLGFVATCNRAATELDDTENDILLLNSDAALFAGALDEMSAVLHLSDKHGVVTARSNHATIATIPVRPAGGLEASAARSEAVFSALREELPRYGVVPVAHGFCFLVRRSLIRNYGLFDEAFAPGYGEENDFCLRVNRYGFSSVMANRAYVHHDGERSFAGPERRRMQDDHERLLIERYPWYPDALRHYDAYGMDAVDRFADFLIPAPRAARVMVDLHHMSLIYDGSVRNALTFLDHLRGARGRGELEGLDFSIAASTDAIEFFDLRRFGFRVVSNADLDEIFDLGFSLAPITAEGQIQRLDRMCVRWVASHLDIISLRVLPLLETEYGRRQVVKDSLRFAERVVSISQATLDDTFAYFPEIEREVAPRAVVIHQGVAEESLRGAQQIETHHETLSAEQAAAIDRGGYVLVVGNVFAHKQLAEGARALVGGERPVVAFGTTVDPLPDGVVAIKGGFLSDADVSRLYDNADVIAYPSAYEGFGLPIAEAALHGRPVVLFDTPVAREVVDALDLGDVVVFFDRFDRLPAAVEAAAALPAPEAVRSVRSIQAYNEGLVDVLRDVLATPPSLASLRHRYDYFASVRVYREASQWRLEKRLARRSVRLVANIADRFQFLRPLARHARRSLSRRAPGD